MTLNPPPDNLEQQCAAISSRHRNSLQFAANQKSRCNLQLTRKLAAICKFSLNLRLLEARHPPPKSPTAQAGGWPTATLIKTAN
jgi:hypothetical protein